MDVMSGGKFTIGDYTFEITAGFQNGIGYGASATSKTIQFLGSDMEMDILSIFDVTIDYRNFELEIKISH